MSICERVNVKGMYMLLYSFAFTPQFTVLYCLACKEMASHFQEV